ncbi:hypothetical protein NPS01_18680 [Nocardioides psychrotolerans]|uniref:Uncharacterized protein n=1 Tax=Nocardioides psychrotolerans TaxID=1005945 RepID=A0A1I3JBZ2_9ACTN|nr:hypothetical protein [Nocardioides psychrotolerans]GEP38205.1 hypothetical protein NPS01_18680 [Nocardioides psychrotolerans]SFI57772.1 hypothetical protein SAMN05216561_11082 [Nocardioides psychrotolerans]
MTEPQRDLTSAVEAATPTEPPSYDGVLARRDRRHTRRRALVASVGAAALVATVLGGSAALRGGDPSTSPPPAAGPSPSTSSSPVATPPEDVPPAWDGEGAPPITLQLDGRAVALEPWTSCFTGRPDDRGIASAGCFDGFPQPPFEDVGGREQVLFSFPLEGWRFTASFTPSGEGACERRITVPVRKTGAYSFQVPMAGPAGSYDVDVFGRGPEGDVITTFAWTTSQLGALPDPSGYVGLVTDDEEGFRAYPLEMGLSDLAETPRRASVTMRVTAADGTSQTIGPISAGRGCSGGGSVSFREGGGSGGGTPFGLGPAPFSYRVEVTLDGTTYIGTAVWPRDERRDEQPYTDLRFDPPLPAYTG